MAPCLDPDDSVYAKLLEALEFSETNRRRVLQIIAKHRPRVEREATERHASINMSPPSQALLDMYVEQEAAHDPKFTQAISNEQWGCRLAGLYGAVHSATQQMETNSLLRALLVEIRTLNTHLNGGSRK